MDTVGRKKRSEIMASIRSKWTGPERRAHMALVSGGIRHDMHPALPGSPDILVGRTAVFVHGCFWHGCPRHYKAPKTRRAFWSKKIVANAARHRRALRALRASGLRTVTLWECRLSSASLLAAAGRR